MSILITFPGQGSQVIGMGLDFYQNFKAAKDVFDEIDHELKEKLSSLIFSGRSEDLTLTRNAQPGLMAVSMAIIRAIEQELTIKISEKVSFFAGHSLGEYTAYCAATAFSLGDTARLLRIRGEAMQEAVPIGVGAMAAILGLDLKAVEGLITGYAGKESCGIANDNSPGQIVISGHTSAVKILCEAALAAGAKKTILLPVSAPFHSSLMQPAAYKMAEALDNTKINSPTQPIISNVWVNPLRDIDDIKKSLVEQVTGRVRWRETIEKSEQIGVTHVIEIGAGKVLTGLSKRISPQLTCLSINTIKDLDIILELIGKNR